MGFKEKRGEGRWYFKKKGDRERGEGERRERGLRERREMGKGAEL